MKPFLPSLVLGAMLLQSGPVGAAEPAAPSASPAKDARQLLQEGLFEEEATHDLEKAAAAYQALVAQYDAQRLLSGTALFRLAEIRLKQGHQAEAAALYQRVLAEFASEERLAASARERLSALGLATTGGTAPAGVSAVSPEEAAELARLQELARNSPDLLNNRSGQSLLSRMAESGYLQATTFLLEHGAQPDGDIYDHSPLEVAALKGRKTMVELLLAHGAAVDGPDGHGKPLTLAAQNSCLEVARVLLAHGASARAVGDGGETALHAAVGAGDLTLVRLLLEKGADPNALVRFPSRQRDEPFDTPFLLACGSRDEKLVKLLLDQGAEVNPANNPGAPTPLTRAALSGNLAVVKMLLDRGAQVSAAGQDGWTPLHRVCRQTPRNVAMVRLLLEHGADPAARTLPEKQTPLRLTVLRNPETVAPSEEVAALRQIWELLLAKGADINARDSSENTLLGAVIGASNLPEELAAWLVQHGADASAHDQNGNTFFAYASGERRAKLEVQFVFPKMVQPESLYAVARLHSYSKPGGRVRPSHPGTSPDWVEVLRTAMSLDLPTPAPGSRLPPARPFASMVWGPKTFRAWIYQPDEKTGALVKTGEQAFDLGERPSPETYPKLAWGGVVVLVTSDRDPQTISFQEFQKWADGMTPAVLQANADGQPTESPFVVRPVVESDDTGPMTGREAVYELNSKGNEEKIAVKPAVLLDEKMFASAALVKGPNDTAAVEITLTEEGGKRLEAITKLYVGKRLAVLSGDRLLAAPQVLTPIEGRKLQVTGNLSEAEAKAWVERLSASPTDWRFVTKPGKRTFFSGQVEIHCSVGLAGLISFSINSGGKGAGSAEIPPEEAWFAYPESPERVWVYGGEEYLTLVSFENGLAAFVHVKAGQPEFEKVPAPVRERFQRAVAARKQAGQ